MQKLYIILANLLLASLLAGCAGRANVQAQDINPAGSGNTPADFSEKPDPAGAAKPEAVPNQAPSSCRLTVRQDLPFVPPSPYSELGSKWEFWYGSDSLWTAVPRNGVWSGLPKNTDGYTQKIFWWRDGYVWREEPEPALIVTGERLDAPAPPLIASKATNAYASDIGSAMLVGVDFPTLGCWRITGYYKDSELSFVIWVAP